MLFPLDNPDHKQMLLKLQRTKINMSETTGAQNVKIAIMNTIGKHP